MKKQSFQNVYGVKVSKPGIRIQNFCLALTFLLVLLSKQSISQGWQQLGPGAGGQERALYLHENVAGNNVLYVGSDVSGIWRSHAINPNDINNPEQYNYEYISNHRIYRFVNKFYRPTTYNSEYLFALNRSGIDRINLNDESESMKQVNIVASGTNFDESWVSDIYIGPLYNGVHRVYFTTGNTRVNDLTDKNHKDIILPNVIEDFYIGELNQAEDQITIVSGISLSLTTAYHDVFCLFTDEGIDLSDPSDDIIYVGSDDGLFLVDASGIVTPISPPSPTAKVITSIQKYDPTTLLITIHGSGIYSFDGSIWNNLMAQQFIFDGSNLVDIYQLNLPNTLDFTQLFKIEVGGTIQGYLAVNEAPKIKSGTYAGKYIGLFYCNETGGLPDGIWTALDIIDSANDWGWNQASPPCANINGATLTKNNELYIGKQGNIFKSENPISNANNNIWQQIYTAETPGYDPPCTESGFRHRGYVNTVITSIFPQSLNKIWDTHYDRLMWYDSGTEKSFIQVSPNGSAPCYNFATLVPCTTSTGPISDAFFIKEYANVMYAGVAEGFGSTHGNGYILTNTPPGDTWAPILSAICGDPLNYFNIGGNDYIFANLTSNPDNEIYFWNSSSSSWDENTSWPWSSTHVRDVKMITIGSINYYIVLANSGVGIQTVYIYEGDLSTGGNLVCSHTNNSGNYILERLEILPYNLANHPFKVIIGASPVNPVIPTSYLFELDVDVLGSSCNFAQVPDNTTAFEYLNLDLIDDLNEGVTALNVNSDRNIIYAATVRNDANDPVPVKSHLYQTSYDPAMGVINPNWVDISGDMPNKAITFLTSRNSTGSCNEQYVYGVLRGLGSWKYEENPLAITTSSDVVCSGSFTASASVNDPFGGGSTFLWSTGATISTITGISSGTYTVTVENGSCSATSFVVIKEDPNCCNTYLDYLDQAAFNGGPPIIGDYNLNDDAVCIGVVTIDGANISIKEGISITVPSGNTLNLLNSTLFACGNMWQGIIVEPGGYLYIDNSEIRDAEYAARVQSDGNLYSRKGKFEHDYVGIYTQDLNGGSIVVEGSTFSCTSCLSGNPLKGKYPGQNTSPNMVTFAGIEAYNSVFNIGVGGGNLNNFTELYRGVSLNDCYNTIINSTFSNMSSNVFYLPFGGYGIYADMFNGGMLRQNGLGEFSFSPVSFENCPVAIYTRRGFVSISSNHMVDVRKGIRIDQVKGQSINASYNYIEASEKGIWLNNNENATMIDVNYNTIFINGISATGISVLESVPPSPTRRVKINCNSITVDDGIDGILLNSTERISLTQNNVLLNSTVNSANGVRINGSTNCSLLENRVTGNSTTKHIAFGTYIAPSNTFTNNHANLTEIGFDFGSGCATDEFFRGNTMGEHNIGLHLNGSGIMGVQTHRGNKWYGPFGLWGGLNENSTFLEISNNPITVHEPTPGSLYHPTNDVPNGSGAQWIFALSGTPWSGAYPSPCIAYLSGGSDNNESKLTYTDSLIVHDSITAVQFEDELKYFTMRDLLGKLTINDSLRSDNGVFENFFDEKSITPSGDLTVISSMFYTSPSTETIETTNGMLNDAMDSLIILDSLSLVEPTNIPQHHSQLISINLMIESLSNYINSYILQIDSTISIAGILNYIVAPSNEVELYEKQVNEFHFSYNSSLFAQLDSADLVNIMYIASLCPYAYGKAVYRARSELMRYGIESNYDDQANCTQLGYLRQSQQQSSSEFNDLTGFSIFPNPVTNELNIKAYGYTVPSEIIIRDVSGRTVLLSNLQANWSIEKLDVSRLTPGIYSITFKCQEDFLPPAKFTIIR